MVMQSPTKMKTVWKTCPTTLHFWIYDCGILIFALYSPQMASLEPEVIVVRRPPAKEGE
jgi:hypothetical protein